MKNGYQKKPRRSAPNKAKILSGSARGVTKPQPRKRKKR